MVAGHSIEGLLRTNFLEAASRLRFFRKFPASQG
jgi:hypothetical protein